MSVNMRRNGQNSPAYTQLRDYESHQMMEQENDRAADELSTKVVQRQGGSTRSITAIRLLD